MHYNQIISALHEFITEPDGYLVDKSAQVSATSP